MNVSLTPHFEKFVQQLVESGRYGSASEVVRAAIRLLQEEERLREFQFHQLKKEVSLGLEQLERGEYTEYDEKSLKAFFEDIKTQGRRRLVERKRKKAA